MNSILESERMVFSVTEVSKLSGKTPKSIRRRIERGEIRKTPLGTGRSIAIAREEVIRFLNGWNPPLRVVQHR